MVPLCLPKSTTLPQFARKLHYALCWWRPRKQAKLEESKPMFQTRKRERKQQFGAQGRGNKLGDKLGDKPKEFVETRKKSCISRNQNKATNNFGQTSWEIKEKAP